MNEYTKRLYEYLSQDSAFAEKYKSPLEFSSALQNKEYAGRMRDYLAQDSAFAEKYPDVDSFYNAISVKKKEQPQQKTFGQPYSPSSQEPTQVSKTDSESIDFGALDQTLPSNMMEAQEDAARRIQQKQEQQEVVSKGRKAQRVIDEVSKLSTNIGSFEQSQKDTPEIISEWGPTSFEQATVNKTDAQKRIEQAIVDRQTFSDDINAYTQSELQKAKPQLDKEYQNLTGIDFEQFVVEQPDGTLAVDPNALNEVEFYSDNFQKLHKELVDNQARVYENASTTQKIGGELSAGASNLYNGVFAWFDPESANVTTIINDAKLRGIKKAKGLSDEQIDRGVIKNFKDGDVEAGLINLTSGVVSNLPQIGVAIGASMAGMPNVGFATLGASAGGAAFADLSDNPNVPVAMKYLIGAEIGAVELLTEKLFPSDVRLARQTLSGLSSTSIRQMSKRIARDFVSEGMIPVKEGAKEAVEESIASVNEQVINSFIEGKPIDLYEVGDAAIIGFSSGGGIGLGNVVSKTPSYIGSYKTANKRKDVLSKIRELGKIANDEASTAEEVAIAEQGISEARRELVRMAAIDDAMYENMSDADVQEVMRLNRNIRRNLDLLDKTDKDVLRREIKRSLQSDFDAKKEIEQRQEVQATPLQQEEQVAEEKAKSDAEDEAFFEQMVEGGSSEAARVLSEEEARLSAQADAEIQSIMAEEEALTTEQEKEAARKQAINEATVTRETMAVERESTKPSKKEGDKAVPKDLTKTEGEQDFTEAERPAVVTSLPETRTPEQEKVQGMVAKAKEALAKKRKQDRSSANISEAVVTPPTAEVSEEIGPDVDYVTDDELADAMVQGAETPSVDDKILSILDKAIEATSGKGRAFDATLGIPMFALNSALKIARAVYVGGKSLAEAVKRAHTFLTSQGYSVDYDKFEEYVKKTLTGKKETDAVQEREAEGVLQREQEKAGEAGGERGGMEQQEQGKEAAKESEQEGKQKGKPQVAKDKKGFKGLLEKVFGLKGKKASAASTIADRVVGTIAEIEGITKEEAYRRLGMIKADKALQEKIMKNPAILFQIMAFHGSPYEFEKFLTSQIGTGEGAQAFGWGLYFTDLESIAREYAIRLTDISKKAIISSPKNAKSFKKFVGDFFNNKNPYEKFFIKELDKYEELLRDGNTAKDVSDGMENYLDFKNNEVFRLQKIIDIFEKYSTDENATKEIIVNKLKSEISEAKESLSKHSKEWKGRKAANRIIAENGLVLEFLETKSADDVFDVFKEFRDELNLTLDEKRKLYKVTLFKGKTPDQYTFLEWDKPIGDKSNQAVKAFDILREKYKGDEDYDLDAMREFISQGSINSSELYEGLVAAFDLERDRKFPKYVSMALLEAGIDGIKYPAESISRGATSDNARGFNYVVFDENAVSIEEVVKFQKDAIAARGAMMMGMDALAILYALTDPNVSTPLHELAHVYEHYLTDEERATIEAASGAKAGTTEFSEYFARGFEKYLSEGVAPDTGNEKTNKSLQKVFDNFKKWLTDIYNGITGSDIDVQLNDEMRSIYDQMLQGDTRSDAEKRRAERESLKKEIEGNQSLQDKVAAFRNFNPEHSYTTAQIELLKDFIKKFNKSGSLLGAGAISQVINGVADAANTKQKAKAGFKVKMFGKTLNVADLEKLAIGDVGIFLNKIFGDGYEKISAKIGFVGVGDAISKSLSNTNNWIANVREFTTKLPRKEKNITSVIKRDYVGIVEQMYHRFKDDLGEAEAIKFGIELIGLSIENQEAANKNPDTIKRQRDVYELIKNIESYDELLNVLSETERGLYEAVIKANSVGYDEIIRLSFDNGKNMERAERYLHIPVRKISEAKKLKELTPDEFEKDPSAVNMLNPFPENFTPKTTGAQEKRVEEADKLKKSFKDGSSYFDIGFEVTQLNSFLRTQMAVRLYQPIVKMNTFLSAKEAIEIFGGVKNDGANNIRVFKELAKYNINADSISKVSLSSLYGVGNVIMKLKRLAVPWLMGNPIQIIKQGSIEVATAARIAEILGSKDAAAMMYRRKDLIKTYLVESRKGKGTLISPDVNNLPWKDLLSQATIWVRNTLEANEFYDNMRDIKMSMNIPLKGWYNKSIDFWMGKWVTSPDRYAAQVAWLSFYEAYLVKNNLLDQSQFYDNDGSFDMNKWLDWIKSEGKNPNKDAMAFATTETRLIHGPSTIYERAMIQHDLNTDNAFINTAYRMVKDMTLPLSVMSMSMSYTQLMSMIKLSSSKYSLKDKKAAAAQLAGLASSIFVFQGVSSFIWPVMKQAVVKTFCESIGIDGDDEDELLGKIKVLYKTPEDFNKSVGIFMTNTFVESLIPFAATSDRAKYYIAKGLSFTFYSIGQSVYGKEYDAKYGKYGFESFDIWYQTKDLKPQAYKPRGGVGYFGFVPEIIYDNYKIGEAGITGKITDEYTGQELYLTEEQKAQSMNIWGLHTLGIAIPVAPAMTTQVAKSSFYELKDLTTDNQIEAIQKEWNSLSEEDKKEFAERTARKMSEYFSENRKKFARDWGVEMSTIKTLDKFSSDIKRYNNKTYMEMAFSVMNGEEKVNPNSVDQFLVRTAREHIPIKAKAIKLYNRLKEFKDPNDRKKYAARIANSSTFLYPEDALIALQFNFRRIAELDKESDSGR